MMLEALEISKEYKRGDRPFFAVDGVSLSIDKGEFICIVGRSGSGKTTLLNMLTGLLTPDSGKIAFDGVAYDRLGDDELSLLRNTRLGYIMQGRGVLRNFTVLQNTILPRALFKRAEDPEAKAISLLDRVGIRHLADQLPARLSGGELRRVSIARALLSTPDLLIADEPTGDLDEETAAEILSLFRSVAEEGTGVLMVTHDLDATSLADRTLVMQSGRLRERA
ncbi:MAG: ABC transporter ATP-binding protein [Clostridiales Family XIII bacterium]|jgi:putative ABC transport system ATP-binding protein|nr:ABC transporter ATP-binding protein [Clostridiales Family XIII bacterium]